MNNETITHIDPNEIEEIHVEMTPRAETTPFPVSMTPTHSTPMSRTAGLQMRCAQCGYVIKDPGTDMLVMSCVRCNASFFTSENEEDMREADRIRRDIVSKICQCIAHVLAEQDIEYPLTSDINTDTLQKAMEKFYEDGNEQVHRIKFEIDEDSTSRNGLLTWTVYMEVDGERENIFEKMSLQMDDVANKCKRYLAPYMKLYNDKSLTIWLDDDVHSKRLNIAVDKDTLMLTLPDTISREEILYTLVKLKEEGNWNFVNRNPYDMYP